MAAQKRRMEDLVSVGPAMARDFELLGIHSVAQLSRLPREQRQWWYWSRLRKARDAQG